MTDFRLLVPVLWAGVISMMPGTAVVADSSAEDDWQFNAGAYPYAAGTKGETASGSDLDVSFTALIDNLDMAFMGNVEARKSNWPRAADVLYLNVGAGGGYREPRSEQATLDLVAGARYLEVSSFLDMSTRLGPLARSRGVAASGNSRDIIIGMRGDVYLKDNCYAPYDADLGTGDSDFTWQIAGWIGYKFDWVTPTSSPVTWTGISNPAPSSTISISADHS